MHIKPRYKVHNVADENIVMVQGRNPGDMTTVVALNATSLFLWNELNGRSFEKEDVVRLLTERFDVDQATADRDAASWITILRENRIVTDEE